MKQRVTSEDIACLVPALNKILDGSYLVQVYDGSADNTKSIIMKFRNKVNGKNTVYYLLLESGIRVHTIDNFTCIRPRPSGCVGKIRKELGDKRLFPIQQIGTDRSMDFLFSNDKHFIIELYDRGNFIITDNNYKILYVTRPYELEDYQVNINKTYPIEIISKSGPHTERNLLDARGYIIEKCTFSGYPFDTIKIVEEFDDINLAMKKYFYSKSKKKIVTVKPKKFKKNRKMNIENQITKLNKKENKALNNAISIEENINDIQSMINIINEQLFNKTPFHEIETIIRSKFASYSIKINHKCLLLNNLSIDYKISAYANVSQIYSKKKSLKKKKTELK